MRKYTQRQLKNLCIDGLAENITTAAPDPERRRACDAVGYSSGVYGCNGCLLRDRNTGKLYVIAARNSNIFYYN